MTSHRAATIAGLTDIGQVRKVNEDAILVDNDSLIYAVADGMGGHGSGDVASKLAVDALLQCVSEKHIAQALANKDISDEQAMSLLSECINNVNQQIYKKNAAKNHPVGTGMGTTLVGICFIASASDEQRAVMFNVGDSRVYEFEHNQLRQLTQDHTMYQDWADNGRIGPAPPRNIILRAIGLFDSVEIDLSVITLNKEATYLLCSDGLNSMLSDDLIARILVHPGNEQKRCYELVQKANQLGGTDNISIVMLAP